MIVFTSDKLISVTKQADLGVLQKHGDCPGSGQAPVRPWGPLAGVCGVCKRIWLVLAPPKAS